MLIKCPKCRSVYELPDNAVSAEGRKLRCCQCGEIWTATPADAIKKPDGLSSKDIKKMFKSASRETEKLFSQPEQVTVEKVRIVNVIRERYAVNVLLLLTVVFCLAGFLYFLRYDIVRLIPQAERIYDKLYIQAIPYGRNLEFKNVTTREFIENNMAKIEIKGHIENTGKYVTQLPPVKISIYDKKGNLLLDINHYLPIGRLEAGYNLVFSVVVTNPSPFGKSIYLTFNDIL